MRRQEGQALAVVLGILFILSLLVAGVLFWSGAVGKGLLIDRQDLADRAAAAGAVNYGAWWAVYTDPGFNLLNVAQPVYTPVPPAQDGVSPFLRLALVNPPVAATIYPASATDCAGTTITFNQVAQDAWGNDVYTGNLTPAWSLSPSTGASINSDGEFTGHASGSYTLYLDGYAAGGKSYDLATPAQAAVQVVTCP